MNCWSTTQPPFDLKDSASSQNVAAASLICVVTGKILFWVFGFDFFWNEQ